MVGVEMLRRLVWLPWCRHALLLLMAGYCVRGYGQPPPVIDIALLYSKHEQDPYREITEFAISNINKDTSLLPHTKLRVIYQTYDETPNSIIRGGCVVLKNGVTGIIVPGTSSTVQLLADTVCQYNIPVIASAATSPFLESRKTRKTLIRMLPSDKYQSQAIFELLKHMGWKQFSILTSFDSYGINGVLELQWLATQERYKIVNVQHIEAPTNVSQLDVTPQLNILKSSLSRVIVLNCNAEIAYSVLEQASDAGLLNKGYSWIVTDALTGTHSLLSASKNHITAKYDTYFEGLLGTRPRSHEDTAFHHFSELYHDAYKSNLRLDLIQERLVDPIQLNIFTRLLYDAVWVMAHALHGYVSRGVELYQRTISCDSGPEGLNELGQPNRWDNGTNLTREIKQIVFDGITSRIEFGMDGSPHNKMYDIVNFRDHRFLTVGQWSQHDGLQIDPVVKYMGKHNGKSNFERPTDVALTLNGSNFVLGVLMETPFVVKDNVNCTGNHCYRGYCIDLINMLAADLDFTYQLVESADRKWGGYDNVTRTWNGLVKMLQDKDIDIAAVHLSVNSLRERAIDFSVPFMDAGLLVVVKGETHNNANKFFFLSPFSKEVWYCILLACVLVTITVCLMNKLSPFGKYGAKMHALMTCSCAKCLTNRARTINGIKSLRKTQEYECKVQELEDETKDRLDQLSMFNSSWVVVASLLAQSPVEGGPYCASGRFVLMAWWFFMMIVLAMYTANLAAFLTVNRLHVGLRSVEDLLSQEEYEWGTVMSTNPEILMKNSIKSAYRKIMQRAANVSSAEEGYRRAAEGSFAFIYESPYLEYKLQLQCDNVTDMIKVGEPFNDFGLAFGLQQNSPFADVLNEMILKYRETGELEELWQKWLLASQSCSNGHVDYDTGGDVLQRGSTLDMSYLSGLFITLLVACLFTILLVVCELIYASSLDAYGSRPVYDNAIFVMDQAKHRGQSWKFWRAIKRRIDLLKYDVREHWWTIFSFKKYVSEEEAAEEGCPMRKCNGKIKTGVNHKCLQLASSLDSEPPAPVEPRASRRYSVPIMMGQNSSKGASELVRQMWEIESVDNEDEFRDSSSDLRGERLSSETDITADRNSGNGPFKYHSECTSSEMGGSSEVGGSSEMVLTPLSPNHETRIT